VAIEAPAGGTCLGFGVLGYARKPVGTQPHLLVVGVNSPIAVPCMALLGARRGEFRRLRSPDKQLSGSLKTEDFYKYYLYTNVKTSRSTSPIFLFKVGYSSRTIMSTCGNYIR
jgi:hypothetical protein